MSTETTRRRARRVAALRGHTQGRALALGILLASVLLSVCPCALALDPALEVSQYAHTAWKVRDGFTKGVITAIAQTPDGYLWLGTEFGLLRFDGVRAVPWKPPAGEDLPSSSIRSLLVAREGTLWIGTLKGLASWKDGRLTQYAELSGKMVDAPLEDHEGTIWVGANETTGTGRLCAIQKSSVQCYGEADRFGKGVGSLYEDSRGNIWVGAQSGLWLWKPGPPKHAMTDPVSTSQSLIEGDNGAVLIAVAGGVKRFVDGEAEKNLLPAAWHFRPTKLLRDRDGGLWIGSNDGGLAHVHHGRTDVFAQSDSLSGDSVTSLFEDHEGNIWVATYDGLDRFRDFAVPAISVKQGLSNAIVWSLLAARDGSLWLGSMDGLNRWRDGQTTIYRKQSAQAQRSEQRVSGGAEHEKVLGGLGAVREITGSGLPDAVESLSQDGERIWVSTNRGIFYLDNGRFIPVAGVPGGQGYSITADSVGDLWISHDQGLFHLRQGRVVDQIPWAKLGHKEVAYSVVPDLLQGGLWLGFFHGGVAYFNDGQVRKSYSAADGLGEGSVGGLQLEKDGTLWIATEGGLSRLKNGHVATLTSKSGLPCDAVNWVVEDNEHSLWLYMDCGLVRILRSELDAWAAAADASGTKDPKRTIQATIFDSSDGVRSHSYAGGYSPRVAKSTDGKLWFLPWDGVSVVDPQRLHFNELPPPVHVEQITADQNVYWQNSAGDASTNLNLPARVRDLQIDYTALSYVAPEKVHFRYKLEGWDRDWQWVGNRRQAFYTNLSPGDYHFRVAASNNSGVWNEAGTSFVFSIAPSYYQTTWFRLSCVAASLAMLWGLYQLRLRQVAREFNVRMEERVNERMRIARELHDTMLQSFQGAVLHFQVVADLISKRPLEAKQKLDSALDLADHAIAEGRDAVQGLRSSTTVTNDVAAAMLTLGKELAATETGLNRPEFRVEVIGATRDLHPIARDEVCRIAGEALRNAFRHAQASRIEVEIQYDPRKLQLRIRDNGKGFETRVVGDKDRPGHYGLPGMRERAKLIGGNLELWSKVQAGTEVELTIPAAAAYAKSAAEQRARFFRKGAGTD